MIQDDPSKRMSWEEFFANPIFNTEPKNEEVKDVSKDEKDSAEEQLAALNLQDVDKSDLIGSDVEDFYYNGKDNEKKFKLIQLMNNTKLKELRLRFNQIERINNIKHLKELKELNLNFNSIKEIQAGCFECLNLTELHLYGN